MSKSEQNANRQLAEMASKVSTIFTSPPCAGFTRPLRLDAFRVAKEVGVNPYNDIRGMQVRR